MGVGEAYGQHHMSGTHMEGAVESVGDMELLEGHLAAFLHLGLVLAVLRRFHLALQAYAARLELYLGTELPVAVELVVASDDETGDGDAVAALVGVARRVPLKRLVP